MGIYHLWEYFIYGNISFMGIYHLWEYIIYGNISFMGIIGTYGDETYGNIIYGNNTYESISHRFIVLIVQNYKSL